MWEVDRVAGNGWAVVVVALVAVLALGLSVRDVVRAVRDSRGGRSGW
jgi:hypothetical protein